MSTAHHFRAPITGIVPLVLVLVLVIVIVIVSRPIGISINEYDDEHEHEHEIQNRLCTPVAGIHLRQYAPVVVLFRTQSKIQNPKSKIA
ncbi:MAG: hypothetical protein FJY92_01135 [Candidatus Hydrogenedentes bacterium]|nr:hypothetical protein [Candidatus Hydrogenedentota bacterium]